MNKELVDLLKQALDVLEWHLPVGMPAAEGFGIHQQKRQAAISAIRAELSKSDAKPFDYTTALMFLIAAAKSGDPGTIRLAAQLVGAYPCERCDYVNIKCRCPKTGIFGDIF